VGSDKKLKELEEVGGTGTQVTKELDTGTMVSSIALPAGNPPSSSPSASCSVCWRALQSGVRKYSKRLHIGYNSIHEDYWRRWMTFTNFAYSLGGWTNGFIYLHIWMTQASSSTWFAKLVICRPAHQGFSSAALLVAAPLAAHWKLFDCFLLLPQCTLVGVKLDAGMLPEMLVLLCVHDCIRLYNHLFNRRDTKACLLQVVIFVFLQSVSQSVGCFTVVAAS